MGRQILETNNYGKIEGEIGHSCRHGNGPHWIKVCIVKKDQDPEVWKKILEIAGPKPK